MSAARGEMSSPWYLIGKFKRNVFIYSVLGNFYKFDLRRRWWSTVLHVSGKKIWISKLKLFLEIKLNEEIYREEYQIDRTLLLPAILIYKHKMVNSPFFILIYSYPVMRLENMFYNFENRTEISITKRRGIGGRRRRNMTKRDKREKKESLQN